MRYLKSFFLILISLVVNVNVQGQREAWGLNIQLSHFDRIKKNELNLGGVGYNVNPGLELLYNHRLNNSFRLESGISYQYIDIVSHVETSDRFRFGEISVPLLMTVSNQAGRFAFSTGIYAGKFLHFQWDKRLHSEWVPVNYANREHYSDQNLYMDVYLSLWYKLFRENKSGIKLIPFVRCRFKDNWMDHYRSSIYYGLKFNVTINQKLKNNEDCIN